MGADRARAITDRSINLGAVPHACKFGDVWSFITDRSMVMPAIT
jgi:hypothetical protein